MTTIMQPFHCGLQPQIQETNRTTHTGRTTRCRTQRRNRLTSKRSKPHPPHTRGTFHRRLQPLYMEKYKVSCSGFLSNTSPMQHSCVATSLRHHFPSSPLPFVTTLSHSFLFFCYVLLCYVLWCDVPPFIKVNSIASYSFVMYSYVCIVMWCTTLHQGQFHSFLFFCYV